MKRTFGHRLWTLLLLACMAGGGFVAPAMDAVDLAPRTLAFDDGHDPDACHYRHDHTICVQQQHSRALTASVSDPVIAADLLLAGTTQPAGQASTPASDSPALPRAPPHA